VAANLISRKASSSCVALESLDVDIAEKFGGLGTTHLRNIQSGKSKKKL